MRESQFYGVAMGADELTDALLATTGDPEAWADVAYDKIVPNLGDLVARRVKYAGSVGLRCVDIVPKTELVEYVCQDREGNPWYVYVAPDLKVAMLQKLPAEAEVEPKPV